MVNKENFILLFFVNVKVELTLLCQVVSSHHEVSFWGVAELLFLSAGRWGGDGVGGAVGRRDAPASQSWSELRRRGISECVNNGGCRSPDVYDNGEKSSKS